MEEMVGCVKQGTTCSRIIPHDVRFLIHKIQNKSTEIIPPQRTTKGAPFPSYLFYLSLFGAGALDHGSDP